MLNRTSVGIGVLLLLCASSAGRGQEDKPPAAPTADQATYKEAKAKARRVYDDFAKVLARWRAAAEGTAKDEAQKPLDVATAKWVKAFGSVPVEAWTVEADTMKVLESGYRLTYYDALKRLDGDLAVRMADLRVGLYEPEKHKEYRLLFGLDDALFLATDHEYALKRLNQMVEEAIPERKPGIVDQIARRLLQRCDFDGAKAAYQRAIKLSEATPETTFNPEYAQRERTAMIEWMGSRTNYLRPSFVLDGPKDVLRPKPGRIQVIFEFRLLRGSFDRERFEKFEAVLKSLNDPACDVVYVTEAFRKSWKTAKIDIPSEEGVREVKRHEVKKAMIAWKKALGIEAPLVAAPTRKGAAMSLMALLLYSPDGRLFASLSDSSRPDELRVALRHALDAIKPSEENRDR